MKQFKMKLKNKKERFLVCYLLSLLGNILAGKGMNRAGQGIVRADYAAVTKN